MCRHRHVPRDSTSGTIRRPLLALGRPMGSGRGSDGRNGRFYPSIDAEPNYKLGKLGGQIHGTASLDIPTTQNDLPSYTVDGSFTGLNSTLVGQLAGQKWKGGPLNGSGNLAFSGLTPAQIAASIKGSLQFDWKQGEILTPTADAALANFDHWSGKAIIGDSNLDLAENQLSQGNRKQRVYGKITLTTPPAVRFTSISDR